MKKQKRKHYFDQRPRKSRKDLFGRDYELEQLMGAMEAGSWAVILGPRMVGKTSLAWAAASEFSEKNDYQVVFVDLRTARTSRRATEKILGKMPASTIKRLSKYLSEVRVHASGIGATLKLKEYAPAKHALEDALLSVENTVLILDEIQNVTQGVESMLGALGTAFNENDSLLILFTGSYAGVVRKLLRQGHRDSLFGRIPFEITLHPWPEWKAAEFLENGFRGCGVPFNEREIASTIHSLGTLPGWLNLYGLRRCLGLPHENAVKVVFEKAVREAEKELENLLKGRSQKARLVVKKLAYGATWSELERTGISKDSLHRLLNALINELFIVEKDEVGVYRFTDPVYRYTAERLGLNQL
ncbi:ATP-binding protein [Thermococcus sp. AM4]|uniref:AAA family ATPase n=1 Tax=Thermococcus sp. (strain AM4) TaxID=246969 RepID=UPI0001870D91|nr:ATP-binding protein [Thermococcus sp. AM4]EEB74183.1 Archeal ATPase family protein [Thermococcus sp. AM4]